MSAETAVAMRPDAPAEATSMIQVIERVALNPHVDIDKMQRLLDMQERIMARTAKASYAAALSQLQPELPIVAERGSIKNGSGNVQSKYALWEDVVTAIVPVLARHGFSLSFRTANDDKGVTVTGVLSHSAGHSEETSLKLPIDTSGSKNAVQSVGSSTSYGKRYIAAALLNLRTGDIDDDGRKGGDKGGECISERQVADINALIQEVGADKARFLRYIKADRLEDILAVNYSTVVRQIEAKRKR